MDVLAQFLSITRKRGTGVEIYFKQYLPTHALIHLQGKHFVKAHSLANLGTRVDRSRVDESTVIEAVEAALAPKARNSSLQRCSEIREQSNWFFLG